MKRRSMQTVMLALLLFALPGGLTAETGPATAATTASAEGGLIDVAAYLAEREVVMAQVEAGELGRISRRNRNELNDAWATIRRLLSGIEAFDQIDPAKRSEFYAAQSRFSAIVAHQREHGLVCREVAPTGTRIPRLVCERVAEREARRLRSKEAVDALQRPTCVPGQGGSAGNC